MQFVNFFHFIILVIFITGTSAAPLQYLLVMKSFTLKFVVVIVFFLLLFVCFFPICCLNAPTVYVQPAVAPICYAHLAATQLGQWMKFEDASETSSSHNGTGSGAAPAVPPMPKLNEGVRNTMFFC